MNHPLLDVLKGCLNSNTIHASENALKELAKAQNFTEQLLQLLPDQQAHLLVLVMSTLKNYLMANYNSLENPISLQQKTLLKDNILNMYYAISNNVQAVNLYKEILYIVIAVDYPWQNVDSLIENDLQGNIIAAVYFFRQVCKVYEWFTTQQDRLPLEHFINNYFPKIQLLIEKILANYNEATAKILQQILKAFYSAFHIEIPHYLRNFDHVDKWMLYLKTIFDAHIDQNYENQRLVARIYLKFFSTYSSDQSDGKDFKGWGQNFRQRYAQGLFEHNLQYLFGSKLDKQTTADVLNCMHEVVKSQNLRILLNEENTNILIYQKLLPMAESTSQDLHLFVNDEIEYIRRYFMRQSREDDLTCHIVRRAAFDLIERITYFCQFNNKSELMTFVQFAAASLDNSQIMDLQRQYAIRYSAKLGTQILKNKYLKSQFEALTQRYFIPLLKINHPLHNSLTCTLLSLYLPYGELSDDTVRQLMGLIYEKMISSNSMVLKYNAILAFTALLNHKAALEAAKPHFQTILEIYVKILDVLDHQNLLSCLESIVKNFASEIAAFAPDLVNHLINMFYSFSKNNEEKEEEDPEDDDGCSQATAALSTIKQILQCNLDDHLVLNLSQPITELLKGIFNELAKYFDEILSLFNVLVYKAKAISDFQTPYVACRKLFEGDNSILQNANIPNDFAAELFKAEKADSEFDETLISILKNLIQKMSQNILYKFAFPTNPQLILCLIQNKKISANDLASLNTSQVDQNWSLILQSYTFISYGIGSVSQPNNLKTVTGVSLFPWLKQRMNAETVRHTVFMIEEEEEDEKDELIEQNTMQLLQKYADQDDQEEEDYYASSGLNYSFLYDSPYDCTKDKQMLIFQLRNISQAQASSIMNNLTPKYRKKVQSLFN